MGLVYRALWNDDRANLHSAVADTFLYWANKVSLQTSEPFVLDPFEVEADGSQVCAAQVTIYHEQSSLSANVSTVRHEEGQQILLEADLKSGDSHKPYRGALSQLTRDLIDDGVVDAGRPRGAVLDISVGAQPLDEEAKLVGLSSLISDPNRTVAVVVAMFDYADYDLSGLDELKASGVSKSTAEITILNSSNDRGRARADDLAGLLAGVAVVKWVPQGMVLAAQRELDPIPATENGHHAPDSEDWYLNPGRVRLYPVGMGAEDRSRTYHETVVRSQPGALAEAILSAVEPGLIGLRLPPPFLAVRRLLEDVVAENDESLASEAREQELQEGRELIAQLREDLELHRELLDETKRQNDELTLELVNYQLQEGSSGSGQVTPPQVDNPPASVSEAISRVRQNEMQVEIPDEALKDLGRLDTGINARSDAREVWRGLLALHWYAREQQKEGKYRDFAHWCKRSRHGYVWSAHPQKLAMNESKSVRRDPRLRSARECPVSSEIEPSGRMLMCPHLKISTGTQHAPRLYFYDDSLGATGKIHVGFIGSHDLMPNSTT